MSKPTVEAVIFRMADLRGRIAELRDAQRRHPQTIRTPHHDRMITRYVRELRELEYQLTGWDYE